ncbi:TRAP transporter substrate-binding protein [Psychromonas algicola]|uniref:TRAP transporter substrate-binding protein n=1 Tax=Psychromonas algicola TaxID=2555642 RepID=UPI001067FD6D|nr:TRAP transporter substrate-binding protein [Psychromonas sp. RZ5]TEW49267.1 TRAP transporter substrate-binding protein [Psychromonas sp. RZ5]
MPLKKIMKRLGMGITIAGVLLTPFMANAAKAEYKWKMVTTWPKNFPGVGTGANELAELINEMSDGRIQVKVYGAKELVGALEVFDAVSRGTAEMGHGASYYWKGKVPSAQFFTTVPFGLTAQELNGWIYYGGGLALWQEVYEPFGVLPMPGGNTGAQMGGWFNKKIDSLADLKGLKMRIPGLGGEILKRAGGTPVLLPGSEIFPALQSGTIDATEWVGPYNDLAFGLNRAAKYYYYPGWHEPGSSVEVLFNKEALAALPKNLQSIVLNATKIANANMLAEYTTRNSQALAQVASKGDVQILPYPEDVLKKLNELSEQVVKEESEKDEMSKKVYASYKAYRDQVMKWHDISERAFLNARSLK